MEHRERDVRERIYDAVFEPDLWLDILTATEALSGAASSSLIVFDATNPLRFVSTPRSRPLMERFVGEGLWRDNRRMLHYQANPITGFVRADEYFGAGLLAADAPHRLWAEHGLGAQVGTIIAMPTGQVVALAFERWLADGPFPAGALATFQRLYADFARACLIGTRMATVKERERLDALTTLGIPAAILGAGGRLRAANADFEALRSLFVPLAYDGLAINDRAVDTIYRASLQDLLAAGGGDGTPTPTVRSIAVPVADDRPPMLVHLMPLGRVGLDLFSSGRVLVAVSPLSASGLVPSPTLLSGLFDLTPAEARLARFLAGGGSVKAAAASFAVTEKTARTYLERIFRKTGATSQAQLVALLNSGPASGISTPD
ncbi:helix-turn-helix transcriptional regulator [Ciceribacter sp. L1K22]|uniref:helix-turn-helix transcriptional regulator n=1 Tax=Ciceribacter sp. L1K22 TaxID=2820275 RepID=UPI001ABED777|nr:helix-turn-helix transcriptional regulator [Ciceribacter sp. L1K22]